MKKQKKTNQMSINQTWIFKFNGTPEEINESQEFIKEKYKSKNGFPRVCDITSDCIAVVTRNYIDGINDAMEVSGNFPEMAFALHYKDDYGHTSFKLINGGVIERTPYKLFM